MPKNTPKMPKDEASLLEKHIVYGDIHEIEPLLRKNVNLINVRFKSESYLGYTPLMLVAAQGAQDLHSAELANLLFFYADPKGVTEKNILEATVEDEKDDFDSCNAAALAAYKNNITILKFLLKKDPKLLEGNITRGMYKGFSLLMLLAFNNGISRVTSSVKEFILFLETDLGWDKDKISEYINITLDPTIRSDCESPNYQNYSALHFCMEIGNIELAKLLCEYGADPFSKSTSANELLQDFIKRDNPRDRKLIKQLKQLFDQQKLLLTKTKEKSEEKIPAAQASASVVPIAVVAAPILTVNIDISPKDEKDVQSLAMPDDSVGKDKFQELQGNADAPMFKAYMLPPQSRIELGQNDASIIEAMEIDQAKLIKQHTKLNTTITSEVSTGNILLSPIDHMSTQFPEIKPLTHVQITPDLKSESEKTDPLQNLQALNKKNLSVVMPFNDILLDADNQTNIPIQSIFDFEASVIASHEPIAKTAELNLAPTKPLIDASITPVQMDTSTELTEHKISHGLDKTLSPLTVPPVDVVNSANLPAQSHFKPRKAKGVKELFGLFSEPPSHSKRYIHQIPTTTIPATLDDNMGKGKRKKPATPVAPSDRLPKAAKVTSKETKQFGANDLSVKAKAKVKDKQSSAVKVVGSMFQKINAGSSNACISTEHKRDNLGSNPKEIRIAKTSGVTLMDLADLALQTNISSSSSTKTVQTQLQVTTSNHNLIPINQPLFTGIGIVPPTLYRVFPRQQTPVPLVAQPSTSTIGPMVFPARTMPMPMLMPAMPMFFTTRTLPIPAPISMSTVAQNTSASPVLSPSMQAG